MKTVEETVARKCPDVPRNSEQKIITTAADLTSILPPPPIPPRPAARSPPPPPRLPSFTEYFSMQGGGGGGYGTKAWDETNRTEGDGVRCYKVRKRSELLCKDKQPQGWKDEEKPSEKLKSPFSLVKEITWIEEWGLNGCETGVLSLLKNKEAINIWCWPVKGTQGKGWQSGCSQSNRTKAVHDAEMNKILEILVFKNL